MKLTIAKAIIISLLIGFIGIAVSVLHYGQQLEENYGLQMLFERRGDRPSPSDVVIVALDKASADRLNLERNAAKWNRSYHAQLISKLNSLGAKVIVFDIIFKSPSNPKHDDSFAAAMKQAGNVILTSQLEEEKISGIDGLSEYLIENIPIMPIPSLKESALAVGPLLLFQELTEKLNQYWLFKPAAGNIPSLVPLVFQYFALDVYDDFLKLLKSISSSDRALKKQVDALPKSKAEIIETDGLEGLVRSLSILFRNNPQVSNMMLSALHRTASLPAVNSENDYIERLIQMYQSPDAPYLDYYGPIGTIKTIPYYRLIQDDEIKTPVEPFDFKGKAVFVGSARMQNIVQDEYPFAFSKQSGGNIQGVEIAATAFANLLEDSPIRMLDPMKHLMVVSIWALLLGALCIRPTMSIVCPGAILLCIIYLEYADFQFSHSAVFYPVVVPIFIQAPAFLLSVFLWKLRHALLTNESLKNFLKRHYPGEEVNRIAKEGKQWRKQRNTVYGTCMQIDVEESTPQFETMKVKQISAFIDDYYDMIFRRVEDYDGRIMDYGTEYVMSQWTAPRPDDTLRKKACLAALGVLKDVRMRNASADHQMKVRIGMYTGEMEEGDFGAHDRWEFHSDGPPVYKAKRLEDLNKAIGTRILAAAKVLDSLDDFLVRKIGSVKLRGIKDPIETYELICLKEESTEQQRRLCSLFAKAVSAFKVQAFSDAIALFDESMRICKEGIKGCRDCGEKTKRCAALLYMNLCEDYMGAQIPNPWNGVIRMDN